MLETGNYAQAAHANGREGTMTATEYKTEFTMWAISASPLTVTTPIMNCTVTGGSHCNNVSLTRQHSQAKCTQGVSFGCGDDGNMWTKDGCRGDFLCNGKKTTCNVDGDGTHVCPCGATGAFWFSRWLWY